ncbi:MAG: hypothetical protein ABF261_05950 [Candidatus Arcticimaribacter sp.]
MKTATYSTLKTFGIIGLLFGFACGFLYGIGGFVHDYLLTGINHGSYLALNALWGMPLIFGIMGLALGLVFLLLRHVLKR